MINQTLSGMFWICTGEGGTGREKLSKCVGYYVSRKGGERNGKGEIPMPIQRKKRFGLYESARLGRVVSCCKLYSPKKTAPRHAAHRECLLHSRGASAN